MINVSSNIKNSCKADKNTHTEYVVINGQTIYISGKLSATAYKDTTFFGTFNMKVLQFETENTTQFRNREFEYYKVIDGNAFKIGTFITTEVVDNDSNDSVKVTADDYALKFAIPYTTELDYDSGNIKLYDVLKECCDNAGVELENEYITNGTFVVDNNQFVNGEMIGDVICAIAGISGNFATITNNDKLRLAFLNGTGDLQSTTIDGSSTIYSSELKDIELKANTTQKQTMGNLLYVSPEVRETNGLTITKNSDGSIKINGTSTAFTYCNINTNYSDSTKNKYFTLVNGKTYTLYIKNHLNGISATVRTDTQNVPLIATGGTSIATNTYSNTTDKKAFAYLGIPSGKTFNNNIIYPQVVEGSYTTSTIEYEPYTNGATPNPNYPQEVVNVTGLQEIKAVGKNLFDKDNANVLNAYINASGVITSNSPDRTIWLPITPNTDYTFQMTQKALNTSASADDVRITLFNTQPALSVSGTNVYSQTRTSATSDYNYIKTFNSGNNTYVGIKILNVNKSDYDETLKTIQLEKGSTATTYEPYQEQVSEINLGKNLIPNNLTSGGSSGITYVVNSDGSIHITGTASARLEPDLFNNSANPIIFQAGTYKNTSNRMIIVYANAGYNVFNANSTVTFSEQKRATRIYFRIESGETNLDEIFYPQIIKNGVNESYSPYFTPIELCKIGNYENKIFKTTGKNLFDKDNATYKDNYIIDDNGNETYTSGFGYTTSYTAVKPNTTYTMSGSFVTTTAGGRIIYYDINNNFISKTSGITYTNVPYTFETPNNCYKIRFQYVIAGYNASTIQLELGSSASQYEPFGSNNEWYLKKAIGKVVLNGSENWYSNQTSEVNRRFHSTVFSSNKPIESYKAITNYFEVKNNSYKDGANIYANDGNIYLWLDMTIANTTDAFKTWLSTHNTIVYYAVTSPTYEKLNDTLQKQLTDIKTMPLFSGVNNITTTAPFYISYIDNDIETLVDYTDLDDKRDTQPITSVSIGTSQVEGQEAVLKDESMIAQYGEHWLNINDNPFGYTLEKRQELVVALFNKVKGFGYSSFTSKYTYRPYLELGDKIKFKNKAGNLIDSVILRYEMDFDDCTFEAPSITSATIDYEAVPSTEALARRAEIIANQATAQINAVVTEQNDLEDRVDKAEATLDTQGARLDIVSTHIDQTTGDVLELKRTNYEFGANGIVIESDEGFKSIKNTTGDYYYEQDTMIGKYTKDGSVQKDLALFGKYYYGIDEELDVESFSREDALFLAQLYTDSNNEDGFGHFWNGE